MLAICKELSCEKTILPLATFLVTIEVPYIIKTPFLSMDPSSIKTYRINDDKMGADDM